MSNLELIQRLCCMLDAAQGIIREQAEILAMHGIETDTGELEQRRSTLLFQDATQGGQHEQNY